MPPPIPSRLTRAICPLHQLHHMQHRVRASGQAADTLPGEQEDEQALEKEVAAAAHAAEQEWGTPMVQPTMGEALRWGPQAAVDGGDGAEQSAPAARGGVDADVLDEQAAATLVATTVALMALAGGAPSAVGAAAAVGAPRSSHATTVRNPFYIPVRRRGQVVHPLSEWVRDVRRDMVWVLQLLHPCYPTMFRAQWLDPDAYGSGATTSPCEAWHFVLKHVLGLQLPMPLDKFIAFVDEQGRSSRQVSVEVRWSTGITWL
jgi:hypothetical protein